MIRVSASSLIDFKKCRQLAQYKRDGWRPKLISEAIQVGSMTHWLIEQHHAKKDLNIKRYLSAEGIIDDRLYEQSWQDNIWFAQELAKHYILFWRDSKLRDVLPEFSFEVPYNKFAVGSSIDRVVLVGRCDALFKDRKGNRWILETKTSSGISENIRALLLPFDFQSLFYLNAISAMERKIPAGVLFNVICKPQIRQNKSDDTLSWRKKITNALKKNPDQYFHRYEVSFSRSDIEEFQEQLHSMIREYVDWCFGVTKTYRNESACTGRFNCSFLHACSTKSMNYYNRKEVKQNESSNKKEIVCKAKRKAN